jgi:hypothetical protein
MTAMTHEHGDHVHANGGHGQEHGDHVHANGGRGQEHGDHVHANGGHGQEHGDHVHGHRAENYADRPHPEFVVLDIGDDVGALIIHTDGDLQGVEVEISPAQDDARRSHKEVLERKIAGRPAFTGVFDGLRQGRYTLWIDGEPRARGVAITGGKIAELDWRTVRAESVAD